MTFDSQNSENYRQSLFNLIASTPSSSLESNISFQVSLSDNQTISWVSHNDSEQAFTETMDTETTESTLSVMNSTLDSLGFGIPNTPLANTIVHYCFGVLLILIGTAGAAGNGVVLYVFTRYRRYCGGGVPLILSLAAGDFTMSILHIMPAYSSFVETWSFGKLGCEIYAASVGLCGLAGLLTLSVIAVERFAAIMGTPCTFFTSRKACIIIWVVSGGLVFPPFVGWSRYVVEGLGTSCSWDYTSRDMKNRLYYIFLLTFGFAIPVFVIIISYLGILHVVWKQSSQMNGFSRNGGLSKKGPSRTELKTTKVILCIITAFLISWTPYAVCSLIGQFGDVSLLSPLSTALPAIFAKASVTLNPIIYGLTHSLFRAAFTRLKAQHFGKRNYGGTSLNPRHHYNHNHHHQPNSSFSTNKNNNKHLISKTKKMDLVVKTKENGRCQSTAYDRHHNPIHLDGQKGKSSKNLLRQFTTGNGGNSENHLGRNNGRKCAHKLQNDSDSMTLPSSPRFKDLPTEQALVSVTSPTITPRTSFRNRNALKKGIWVFKQSLLGPTSDSEVTGRTAVVTCNESTTYSSDGVEELEASSGRNKRKYDMSRQHDAGERQKRGERFMKNSYTFFLCEYRKRRQENIRKIFRSENCLISDSSKREERSNTLTKSKFSSAVETRRDYLSNKPDNDELVTCSSVMTSYYSNIDEKCGTLNEQDDDDNADFEENVFVDCAPNHGRESNDDKIGMNVVNHKLYKTGRSNVCLYSNITCKPNKTSESSCISISNQAQESFLGRPLSSSENGVSFRCNHNDKQQYNDINAAKENLRRSSTPITSSIIKTTHQRPFFPRSSSNSSANFKQGLILENTLEQRETSNDAVDESGKGKKLSENSGLLLFKSNISTGNMLEKVSMEPRINSTVMTCEKGNLRNCNKKKFRVRKSVSLLGFKQKTAVQQLSLFDYDPNSVLQHNSSSVLTGASHKILRIQGKTEKTIRKSQTDTYFTQQNSFQSGGSLETEDKYVSTSFSEFWIDKSCDSRAGYDNDNNSGVSASFLSLDKDVSDNDFDGNNDNGIDYSTCSESCYESCRSDLYSDSTLDEDDAIASGEMSSLNFWSQSCDECSLCVTEL